MSRFLFQQLFNLNQVLKLIQGSKVYCQNKFVVERDQLQNLFADELSFEKVGLKLRWVVGNEAADLDSIVSVLSYSCISNYFHLFSNAQSASLVLNIPLINIPRSELVLRPEVLYLLQQTEIDVDQLYFIDDSIVQELSLEKYLSELVLMDHNLVHFNFNSWSGKVVKVIDHHKDENCYDNLQFKLVNQVGSNCSNITFWYKFNQLSLNQFLSRHPDLNLLLLIPILIDTVNLKGSYGRCTSTDTELAQTLLNNLNRFNGTDYTSEYYFTLYDGMKANIDGLSLPQLFQKDFKIIKLNHFNLGISSIINFDFRDWNSNFVQKEKLLVLNSCTQFSNAHKQENCLDVFVVMLAKHTELNQQNSFQRQLLLFAKDGEVYNYLKKRLLEEKVLELVGNQELDVSKQENIATFNLNNSKVSRKVLLPTLQKFLQEFQG